MIRKTPAPPNRRFKKQESAKVSAVGVYLPGEAQEEIPERTNLNQHQANVKPKSNYFKSLDPMPTKAAEPKVRHPKIFSKLTYENQDLATEIQKHHLHRANARLTGEAKKQQFEDLINNYFYNGRLVVAQQNLAELVNAPSRVLNPDEIATIGGQIRNHDAALLNDTNALVHIVNNPTLRDEVRRTMTADQFSSLLKYALKSMYRRSAQKPPEWLGAEALHTEPPLATESQPSMTKTEENVPVHNPDATTEHRQEAEAIVPDTRREVNNWAGAPASRFGKKKPP
jgi:hypothetical protein